MGTVALHIAVVIASYDNAQLVEQSIVNALEQSLAPSEVIIVHSEPTSPGLAALQRIATRCPVRLLRKPRGGRSSALNFAIANSDSGHIAFLDQGYKWYPTHLEELAKPFVGTRDQEVGWVYSDFDEVDRDGKMVAHSMLRIAGARCPIRDVYEILSGAMVARMSASLISRKAFDAVGRFDESLTDYEDEDLLLRMFRMRHDIIFVDKSLSQWWTRNGTAFYFPRRAGSDIIYLKKLLRDFPDDPNTGRFFARDFVVPRFFARLAIAYATALRSGRSEDAIALLPDLSFVIRQHKLRIRLFMKLVLPILHFPNATRCLLLPLLPLLRLIKQRALRIVPITKAEGNRSGASPSWKNQADSH